MSDYRNQYNEESARVTQQAVKSQPVSRESYPAGQEAPVRRRRSDRYMGDEAAPVQEYQRPAAPQEYARPDAPRQTANQQWVRQQPPVENNQRENNFYPSQGNQRSPYVDDAFSRRPVMLDEAYDEEDEEEYRSPWLKIILIVLAVLIALFAVLYFAPIPEDSFIYPAKKLVDNCVGSVKNLVSPKKAPDKQVLSFETIQNNGVTNSRLMFRLTTDQDVQNATLVDIMGQEIPCSVNKISDDAVRIWNISTEFTQPFQGQVYARILTDNEWTTTGHAVSLVVVSPTLPPSLATQAPVATPTPYLPAAAAPTQTPAPTPTLAPTQTPVPYIPATAAPTQAPALIVATWAPVNTLAPVQTSAPIPTQIPTPVPTAIPTPVPTPEPTAVPTPTPQPTKTPLPQLEASAGSQNVKVTDTVYKGGTVQNDYQRTNGYMAPHPDDYAWYKGGVLTFRGDNFRRNAAFGTTEVENEKLSILWKSPIGSLRTDDSGTLYGVGWSGQPAIVKWTVEVREMMDSLYEEKRNTKALREVIFGAQDGKIYFLDLNDGSATRDPISIGYPIKGSVAIDTYGRPMLAVGQGISKLPNKQGDIGMHVFNLIDNEKFFFVNGRQSNSQKQYSTNGAFDGTPLFLYSYGAYANDALIMAGENGLLYTVDLNPTFTYPESETDTEKGNLEVKQDTHYLRTKVAASSTDKAKNQVGVESSVAMYNQYIYLADTYGLVRCVDSDTMQTVWAVDTGDNVDAAIALDMDGEDSVSLYTGNTAYSRLGSKKDVTIRRLDALTGNEIWQYTIKCDYNKDQLSGCKASPVIGQNEIQDLVIFTVNMVDGAAGRVIAFNKENGKVAWQYDLKANTVSSPVAVYNEAGEAWIIQADGDGTLYLLDGTTGALRNTLNLGGSIQGSPAVYKDILVIGTCSKDNSHMYAVKID